MSFTARTLQTTATGIVDLGATYERMVERWLQETDRNRQLAIYDQDVFPLSCERMRLRGEMQEPLDLLFVPVGTQPYAPILGILANPSKCIALLETDESRPYGEQVERSLPADSSVFLHVRVEGSQVRDIAEQMKAVYETRGLPTGSTVGADITGGRKTMTAAIAGVGSLFHWRLFYVESRFERSHQGFGHHEQIIDVENVLDVFGTRERHLALELLAAGSCDAAGRRFSSLISESAASRLDRALKSLSDAADLLRQADYAGLRRQLNDNHLRTIYSPTSAALEFLDAVSANRRGTRQSRLGLDLLVAKIHLREGNYLAAAYLIDRTRVAMRLSPISRKRVTASEVIQLNRHLDLSRQRAVLVELDKHLGTGLKKLITTLK